MNRVCCDAQDFSVVTEAQFKNLRVYALALTQAIYIEQRKRITLMFSMRVIVFYRFWLQIN